MIKHILFISVFFSLGFASVNNFNKTDNYYTNYNQALEKSLQTNKPLMLLVVTTTCPWCEKLKKQTLSKEKINNFISKNFIPLILNKDKAQYPTDKFEAKVVPTVFFINPRDEKIINTSFGYKSQKKFLKSLEETISK
jgi:thioredoxin-related protein